MSNILNGGLDQYVAEPFEQQQFGTAGVEGVNAVVCFFARLCSQWSSNVSGPNCQIPVVGG